MLLLLLLFKANLVLNHFHSKLNLKNIQTSTTTTTTTTTTTATTVFGTERQSKRGAEELEDSHRNAEETKDLGEEARTRAHAGVEHILFEYLAIEQHAGRCHAQTKRRAVARRSRKAHQNGEGTQRSSHWRTQSRRGQEQVSTWLYNIRFVSSYFK